MTGLLFSKDALERPLVGWYHLKLNYTGGQGRVFSPMESMGGALK